MRIARYLAGGVIALSAGACFAWGSLGHEAIGEIAARLIAGTNAEQQVKAILGPDLTLAQIAVWPDCAKGVVRHTNGQFEYISNDNAYKECIPLAGEKAAFESYIKRNWDQCKPSPGEEKCHAQYHYMDVETTYPSYEDAVAGVSDHDIVHSIDAAIAVLQGKPAPSPYSIKDKAEALRLLAHFAGDITQPLHTVSIYMTPDAQPVDVDKQGPGPHLDTSSEGGNLLMDGTRRLHAEWDNIPAYFEIGGSKFDDLVAQARTIPAPGGDVTTWSRSWANDTIAVAKDAYGPVTVEPHAASVPRKPTNTPKKATKWQIDLPDDYADTRVRIQQQQLAKAGANLANVLKAIWPDR
ncbi:S1/P1 nuclease [Silvimonas iriomotensis]|uniref:S1/P1 Nuclease n=1 Tax=Silvimonas iriomotensis TaxID=449662 RepID=A0ABQ2P6F6_9NEIS|nr:S1/P1 nuclease [Silvimonas iriomotensis]GGP18829.1 hypothetical protein GCM10010970_07590 [Silvimonas iriomotensis]